MKLIQITPEPIGRERYRMIYLLLINFDIELPDRLNDIELIFNNIRTYEQRKTYRT